MSETKEWRPNCNGLSFDALGGDDATMLEVPFFEEEVFNPLLDLSGDQAPSPDSFSLAFWHFCWDVLKEESIGFFKNFHEKGRFVKSLNASFQVLFPKKGGLKTLRTLISLVVAFISC